MLDYNFAYILSPTKEKLLLLLQKKRQISPIRFTRCPEGSRMLRFLDYMTTARDDVKVVNLRHRPPLPLGNTPGTHFC